MDKTLTISVSVNVVASDIPSVKNQTITVKRWQFAPAQSVGLRSETQGGDRATVSYTNTKWNPMFGLVSRYW